MKEEALRALYERHNIDWQDLATKEAKRRVLIAELDKQAKRRNFSPQPTLEPMLRQLRENRADEADMNSMLEVIFYDWSNRALDPATKKKRPENKILLHSQINKVMDREKLGVWGAAKKVLADWLHVYPKGYRQMAVRFHQIEAENKILQAARYESRSKRFDQIVTKYGGDAEAVYLLGIFVHHSLQLMNAHANGDQMQIAKSNRVLDSIDSMDHPILIELHQLCVSVNDAQALLAAQLPRLRDDSQRKQFLASHSVDDMGDDEAIRKVLADARSQGIVE